MKHTHIALCSLSLDGWGVAPSGKLETPLPQARTPTIDRVASEYFATTLQASGIGVGLPYSEKGNSEVGHLNIGAGRIVHQYLSRITQEVRNRFVLTPIKSSSTRYNTRKTTIQDLHIMGLFSTGNVHGSMEHFLATCYILAQQHNFLQCSCSSIFRRKRRTKQRSA